MANKFWAAAAHQATLSKSSSQIAKGSFELLFAGEETDSASGDTPERINKKSAGKKQKKKQPRAGRESAEAADLPLKCG